MLKDVKKLKTYIKVLKCGHSAECLSELYSHSIPAVVQNPAEKNCQGGEDES